LIALLSAAGLGTPVSAPAAVLNAAQALAAAVRAAPALAAPAREILSAVAKPEVLAGLEPRLDAPTFARLSALSADVSRSPEAVRALAGLFATSEGQRALDRSRLDALFDGAHSGEDRTLVGGRESGLVPSGLAKPAAGTASSVPAVPAPNDAAVLKKAGVQVAGWVGAALAFGAGLHHFLGGQAFSQYLTTYVIEWSMSLDNLVVISAALMTVPEAVRGKALRWGLIGTVAARLLMVTGGIGLVASAHWVFTGFGLFLLATALKMISPKLDLVGLLGRGLKRIMPRGAGRFGASLAGAAPAWLKTPLALGIMAVTGYGVIFALDSVPASLAISKSWFVIFSANAFSVMGLGALFAVIERLNQRFAHLPKGVAGVLAFVGGKMILEALFGIALGSTLSLAVIAVLLGGSALCSLAAAKR
jgi:tellurite resistance protein TerC